MIDQPIIRQGPPLLHDPAPEFRARTTMGDRAIADYRGRWLLLFSHPADFTPVCTTELAAMSAMHRDFEARGVQLIGLSCDPIESHNRWVLDVHAICLHKGDIRPAATTTCEAAGDGCDKLGQRI